MFGCPWVHGETLEIRLLLRARGTPCRESGPNNYSQAESSPELPGNRPTVDPVGSTCVAEVVDDNPVTPAVGGQISPPRGTPSHPSDRVGLSPPHGPGLNPTKSVPGPPPDLYSVGTPSPPAPVHGLPPVQGPDRSLLGALTTRTTGPPETTA